MVKCYKILVKDGVKMKKALSILLSITILLCLFTNLMPSYALTSGNFTYEFDGETAIITGYTGNSTSVTIPATVDNVKVTAIKNGAFKGNTTIASVKISEGIESIGANCFENCTQLATIILPTTIIHMGEKAIYNTAYYNNKNNWRLKRVPGVISGNGNTGGNKVDDSIEWEDICAPVLQYLYLDYILVEIELEGSYSLKYGTRVIADGACKGNLKATEIGLASSIVTIGKEAFFGCESLNRVKNLNVVDYIGDSAFEGCVSLNTLDISDIAEFNATTILNTGFYNNPENWENGTLYLGNRVVGTDAQISENSVRDGTTEIISGALSNGDVVIPATVTKIAEDAFTNKENARILGYSNSYAQTYANEHNITFIDLGVLKKGDLDFNGKIDEVDYSILCDVACAKKQKTYTTSLLGDLDNDGAVDGIDVIILDLMINEVPPSRIKGDVNGDGQVDTADYMLLTEIVSTRSKITNNIMFQRADINGDGAIDAFDAIYLDLYLKNLISMI